MLSGYYFVTDLKRVKDRFQYNFIITNDIGLFIILSLFYKNKNIHNYSCNNQNNYDNNKELFL